MNRTRNLKHAVSTQMNQGGVGLLLVCLMLSLGLSMGAMAQQDIDVTGGPLAFGNQDIDDGATGSLSVVITNVGDATLAFTGAGIALVGSDNAEFNVLGTPASTSIAAGASREVQVTFDPTTVGAKAASLEITTDDPDEATVQVGLSGTGVDQEIDVTGGPLAFGNRDIDDGATAALSVVITNTGTAALNFTGSGVALSGADQADFAIVGTPAATPIAAGASREVQVTFDPTTVGAKTASLDITTDDTDEATVQVGLSGTGVDQEIDVTGGPLAFGNRDIDDGATAALSVVITNTGTATLNFTGSGVALSGADSADFAIVGTPAATPIAAGASREVQVTFDPTTVGAKTASLDITTDDTDEATVQVGLSGTGVDQEIDVTGGPLAFGNRDIDDGATAALSVVITNTGTATLNFTGSGVALSGADSADFAIVGTPAATPIAVGASREVQVTFDPTTVGAKTASLDITTDDTDEATVQVGLSGTGINPEIAVAGTLAFGSQDLDDGTTSPLSVVITNEGTTSLDFTGAGIALSGADAVEFAIVGTPAATPIAAGASREVQVTFTPASTGAKTASLDITTNDSDEATVQIGVSGTGVDQEITVTGGPLAFGGQDVDSGATGVQTVTITNDGNATLNFTGAGITLAGANSPEFQITNSPATTPLAPAGSVDVDVVFDPSSLGPKVATLVITTDDTSEPTVNVALTGTGVGANIFVDGNGDNSDGTSWATAFNSIQAGISAAGAGQQVWVADGTYSEAVAMASGVEVYGGFTGAGGLEETLLSQRDPEANETILDATGNFHGVTFSATTNTRLDGITVTGGNANGGGANNLGGGILILNSDDSNVIANCLVINNAAADAGGGLYASFSSPEIVDTKFTTNTAGATGGGLTFNTTSSGTLRRCTISGNFAATQGGGIAIANSSTTRLINCLISGNDVLTQGGGGVYGTLAARPVIVNCTISDNGAPPGASGGGGGGVWVNFDADTTITNTIFTNNSAGAVYEDTPDADVTMSFCLFFNNPDGDFVNENASGSPLSGAASLEAVAEISDIVDGDPRFVMDTAPITGTWNATPAYFPASDTTQLFDTTALFATGELVGRLLMANAGTSPFQACIIDNTPMIITVEGDATAAPVFAASGETYVIVDYHLTGGSAAIDTGTAAGAPSDDIEGTPRPLGGGVEIGIYEVPGGIDVNPTSLDFGDQDVAAGATSPLSVVAENLGVGALAFTGAGVAIVGPDASAFAVLGSPASSPIASGASREIQVVFDPATVGAKAASLEITTDDPAQPTVVVGLGGSGTSSVPDVDVTGGPLAFGSRDVDDGATASQPITITNVGNGTLTISGVSLVGTDAADFVIAGDTGETTLAASESRTVDIAFNPASPGVKAAALRVASDDFDEPTVDVTLGGTGIDQEIDVTGDPLNFGSIDIDAGATTAQAITISNTGSATLAISSVTLTGADASEFSITSDTGETSLTPGSDRTVQVAFNPGTAGAKTANLTVASDDTDEATVNVGLSGTGLDQEVSVVTSVNFGDVAVDGGLGTQQVVITNVGNTALAVTSVSISGDGIHFAITGDTGETSLAPAGTRTIDLAFNPSLLGALSDTLTVTTDDTDEGTVDIALSGTGTGLTGGNSVTLGQIIATLLGTQNPPLPFDDVDVNSDGVHDASDVVEMVNDLNP